MRQTNRLRIGTGQERVSRAAVSVVEGLESRLHLAAGWGTFVGGTELENATVAKVVASDDFVYVAGSTDSRGWLTGSLLNGGRTDNSGVTDGFVAKYTADGVLVWGRYFGGELNDRINDIVVGEDGAVYVVGTAFGYSQLRNYAFGPAAEEGVQGYAGGASDAVVGKLSDFGEYEWITFVGGTGADTGLGIALAGGSVIVVGDTASSEEWVSNEAEGAYGQDWNSTTSAGYVIALDAGNGGQAWSAYISGGGEDHATAVAADGGNIFITGSTTSHDLGHWAPADFGARSWSGTEADAYLLHLASADGTRMGFTYVNANESGPAVGTAVTMDAAANPIVVGSTPGALRWDRSPLAISPDNVFVAKFQNALSLAYWGVTVDATGPISANDVAVSDDGSVVLAGTTSATAFNVLRVDGSGTAAVPGNALSGATDGYVLRLNTVGEPTALKYFGGTGNDELGGIAITEDDDWFISGTTVSDAIAGITAGTRQGGSDAFLLSTGPLDTTAPVVLIPADSTSSASDGAIEFKLVYSGGLSPITSYPQSLVIGRGKSALTATEVNATTIGNAKEVTYSIPMPEKGWKHGQKLQIRIDPGMVRESGGNSNNELVLGMITLDGKAPTAKITAKGINTEPRTIQVTYDGTAVLTKGYSNYQMRTVPAELYLVNERNGSVLRATQLGTPVTKGARTTVTYQLVDDGSGTYTIQVLKGSFSDAAGNESARDYVKNVTLKPVTAAVTAPAPVFSSSWPASVFSTQSLLIGDGDLLA